MSRNGRDRKGILAVSFGTTYREVCQKTIEACERKLTQSFPGYEIRRAFTSNMIRKILRERDGLAVDDTAQALERMLADGFNQVILQPLHIIPGEEYHEKVLKPAAPYRERFQQLVIGRPILTTLADYREAIDALRSQLPSLRENEAVVLMGHGSAHPANACYSCLQLMFYDTLANVYIGTVEGYPILENIIPRLKEKGIRVVNLMPYMLVAGDHALNDMAGDEEDSWKNILEREGFTVRVSLQGLGENSAYQDIYVRRVWDCIHGNPQGEF